MDQNWYKVGMCWSNNQDNFQLQTFTTNENIAKIGVATFLTHTVEWFWTFTRRQMLQVAVIK